jgi:hypothetical protein
MREEVCTWGRKTAVASTGFSTAGRVGALATAEFLLGVAVAVTTNTDIKTAQRNHFLRTQALETAVKAACTITRTSNTR